MELEPVAQELRALVLVNHPQQAAAITETLGQRGISALIQTDFYAALRECSSCAPELVVVEDQLRTLTGARFLAELLTISWTTSSILICDEDQDAVHRRTEGLGILGNIKGFADVDGLGQLLDRFFDVVSHDKSPTPDQQLLDSTQTATYNPIGMIHTPFRGVEGVPIQPAGALGVKGTVVLDPAFAPGLKDLEGFSHIILIYHFHLSRDYSLEVKPFLDDNPRGVFATRAPRRPNPIGFSTVRLTGVNGNALDIEDVDMVDGTPLLDIKPFVPEFDNRSPERVGWLSGKEQRVRDIAADSRFVCP
jgi:tRNA (adenine37-N6)-methyltransferase